MAATNDAPWYRVRAAHLMGSSRAGTGKRRRAEILARAARRAQRTSVGVGEAVAQDELTPPLWRRLHDRELHWVIVAALVMISTLAAVTAGVGVVVGRWLYAALVRWGSPRIGRLWAWPWVALTAVALALRWVGTDWPRLGVWLGVGRYFPTDFIGWGGWVGWADFQSIAALATLAWSIHAWGWRAVPRGAVKPRQRNRDGSFREPKSKVKLSPEAPAPEPTAPSAPPEPEVTPLVSLLDGDPPLPTTEPTTRRAIRRVVRPTDGGENDG